MTADQKRKQRVRKITPESLKNSALYYLGRFSATEKSLRDMLMRRLWKARKALQPDEQEWSTWCGWVDETIAFASCYSFIDDQKYAESQARLWHEKGFSRRKIEQKLLQKGIVRDMVEMTLMTYSPTVSELEAARHYIRRRRLGAHRPQSRAYDMKTENARDLARLVRAGFSYSIAQEALKISGGED